MYTQEELGQANSLLKKRWLLSLLPCLLLIGGAIWVYVQYRAAHDTSGWVWSGVLTALAGILMYFLGSVYIRPVAVYCKHLQYMLSGPFRDVMGRVTEIDDSISMREGLSCRRIMLNVGDKNDPEDERLLYWDPLKGAFPFAVGDTVRTRVNDKMIADIEQA